MKRWQTKEVFVGSVGVGGANPIRIQSMTTSPTHDVEKTVEQIIRLADAGCEIARVTVQGMKEASACEKIKSSLIQKGYSIPLVADIHFYPPAALAVAEFADKVRINPGNFADPRAQFKKREYDEKSYALEIEKIEEKFAPLILKCKKLKRSMRIGTNHGSLSDRIMNRFGDTPRGMVESALEYTRIARKYDYHEIIYSMKASSTQVMIEAYRLLVEEMKLCGWNYPLHLGVTEAGEGEEGRVKSSIGIGSLLLDGLGDTIRVSLTEDPWFEIDPCRRLIALANKPSLFFPAPKRTRPHTEEKELHRDGSVMLSVTNKEIEAEDFYSSIGAKIEFKRPIRDLGSVDALILKESPSPKALEKIALLEKGGISIIQTPCLIQQNWDLALTTKEHVLFFTPNGDKLYETRKFFTFLQENKVQKPVLLAFHYALPMEDLIIEASAELGALLIDQLGEGVLIDGPYSVADRRRIAFTLLQGCRMRHFKTEFISCPGCGRTLFDLQQVAASIREKTSHLPGVKIAIMGCIVNGPGEMADADFGYVGSKPGKIDLYVGKTKVESDIPMDQAVEKLITLIKGHGRWTEKEDVEFLCH